MYDKENFKAFVGINSGASYITGLNKIQEELDVDIEEEYYLDECEKIISIIESKKKDDSISHQERKYWSDRCSHIKKYVEFKKQYSHNKSDKMEKLFYNWFKKQTKKGNSYEKYSESTISAAISLLKSGLRKLNVPGYEAVNCFYITDVNKFQFLYDDCYAEAERYDKKSGMRDFRNGLDFYLKFLKENNYGEKLREIINAYKLDFKRINEEERYKWEAVKHYKNNWNIDAPDFGRMLEVSFGKTYNLLAAGQYYARKMLVAFANEFPEEVRSLFKTLYDETLPLSERFDYFRAGFDSFVEGKDINHYQDLHAVSVYLTFEYPEKYYIYKYSVWTDFLKNIGEMTPSTKGKHETFKIESSNNICDEILNVVLEDKDLCYMSKSRLDNSCYEDFSYKMLAFDIMFFGSNYVKNEEGDWWPSLEYYNPNLSKEDWKKYILEVEKPYHPSPMQMLRAMLEFGGEASCKLLAQNFGGTVSSYVGCAVNLGKRVKKFFDLPPCMDGNQERFFSLPFLGRSLDGEEGHQYIYKIRPELYDALNEIDLSDVSTYYDEKLAELDFLGDRFENYTKANFLKDVYISEEKYETSVSRLKHKKNLILQGAPGVGKTFAARRLAWSIMGVKDNNRIKFVQFHQSYSYEDFIMGYKPDGNGFSLEKGVFYDFCIKATKDPDNDYFFIIDEINRGNMSKIFGELLMLIENDYRGMEITLAYDKKPFSVPENLYIIGMMNTADRSLAMIDYALRRRFSFVEMTPGFDSEGFESYQSTISNHTFGKLIGRIKALNADIENDASLGKGFCIGHSYFCNLKEDCSDAVLKEIVEYDIVPMLEEYWFDDEAKAKNWSNDLSGVFNG